MAPHGDRKKGKGSDRPGKPELRPNRKEFKKHRKEEKGDATEEQEQKPAPHPAALFNAADDGDFPRGE
jgi:rRNA biogenesis protein RRP5